MSQTFDDSPLFPTVLEAIRSIIQAVAYGVKNDLPSVDVLEPDGKYITVKRQLWLQELRPALEFFEAHELYEDCATCVELMQTLENEPNVEQILMQIKSLYNDDSASHDLG